MSMLTAPQESSSLRTVVALPVVNQTGEKWVEHRTRLEERLNRGVKQAFESRGFTLVDAAMVNQTLNELRVDLTDEEFHRRDPLYSIGEKCKADYIILLVLTENGQNVRNNFFVSTHEGYVTVKVWLLDVKKKEPILSAKSETAKARPSGPLGLTKGSDAQLTAADRVVPAILKPFLDKYPLISKAE
ncbi:MAG: hypothetical protein ACK4XJ_05005 [Fimbriimonadaceae bacterium]